MITETLTYLEMTHPSQLRPGTPVPGMALYPVAHRSPLVRETQLRVARPHGWQRVHWTDREWATWLADPAHRHWLIRHGEGVVGALELTGTGDDVEISAFGLVPDHVGAGLGGHALTLAICQAWSWPPARRVWLYTSDLDHPHAQPNYRSRGFVPYQTKTRHRGDLEAAAS